MKEIEVRLNSFGYIVGECPITGKEQDVKTCSHWDLSHCTCNHFKEYILIAGDFIVLCDYEKKTKKDRLIEILGTYRHNSIINMADEILAIMDEGK